MLIHGLIFCIIIIPAFQIMGYSFNNMLHSLTSAMKPPLKLFPNGNSFLPLLKEGGESFLFFVEKSRKNAINMGNINILKKVSFNDTHGGFLGNIFVE